MVHSLMVRGILFRRGVDYTLLVARSMLDKYCDLGERRVSTISILSDKMSFEFTNTYLFRFWGYYCWWKDNLGCGQSLISLLTDVVDYYFRIFFSRK